MLTMIRAVSLMNPKVALLFVGFFGLSGCSSVPEVTPNSADGWLVVWGVVGTEQGIAQQGAFVRSVASSEGQCDEHAHAGAANPEVTRTDAKGEFRQVVFASTRAYCVSVKAFSADSSRSTTTTVAGVHVRNRAMAPDSTHVSLVFR